MAFFFFFVYGESIIVNCLLFPKPDLYTKGWQHTGCYSNAVGVLTRPCPFPCVPAFGAATRHVDPPPRPSIYRQVKSSAMGRRTAARNTTDTRGFLVLCRLPVPGVPGVPGARPRNSTAQMGPQAPCHAPHSPSPPWTRPTTLGVRILRIRREHGSPEVQGAAATANHAGTLLRHHLRADARLPGPGSPRLPELSRVTGRVPSALSPSRFPLGLRLYGRTQRLCGHLLFGHCQRAK